MRKIKSESKINEISNIALRITDIYNQLRLEDRRLEAFIIDLKKKNDILLEAINPDFTKSNLDEYDNVRDGYWTDLFYALQGYCHLPLENIRKDAEYLFAIVQKFGLTTAKKAYAEESADLEAVLLDLSKDEAREAAGRLQGIAELVELLRSAQSKFHEAQLNYNIAVASENARPVASDVKKEVLSMINQQIVPYLNTMYMIEPEIYKDFYQTVERAISDVNENVLRRRNSNVITEE